MASGRSAGAQSTQRDRPRRGGRPVASRAPIQTETEVETNVTGARRLACISDLPSVLAISATSSGAEARQILGTLLDDLSEQKRIAMELEQRVAQRTSELQVANEALRRAFAEIQELKDQLHRENIVLREEAAGTRGGLAPWQVQRATELMNAKLDGQVPLSRLAEACGLSIRHFARSFRQSMGVPPHRWLLNHRIERAKELLRDPALPLTEIALTCGFADQSHFTRMFTAVVGLSPGLWRRMQSWRAPLSNSTTSRPVGLEK